MPGAGGPSTARRRGRELETEGRGWDSRWTSGQGGADAKCFPHLSPFLGKEALPSPPNAVTSWGLGLISTSCPSSCTLLGLVSARPRLSGPGEQCLLPSALGGPGSGQELLVSAGAGPGGRGAPRDPVQAWRKEPSRPSSPLQQSLQLFFRVKLSEEASWTLSGH